MSTASVPYTSTSTMTKNNESHPKLPDVIFTREETNAYKKQSAMRQMLLGQYYSHWVTLNLHADYQQEVAEKKLRLWAMNVMQRLFDRPKFAGVHRDHFFRYVALPEFTAKGHPHFHLLLWLDESCADYFERIAAKRWKSIVPTGSTDIQRIEQTEADYVRVIEYATKESHRAWFSSNFIEGGMQHLPDVIRASP